MIDSSSFRARWSGAGATADELDALEGLLDDHPEPAAWVRWCEARGDGDLREALDQLREVGALGDSEDEDEPETSKSSRRKSRGPKPDAQDAGPSSPESPSEPEGPGTEPEGSAEPED